MTTEQTQVEHLKAELKAAQGNHHRQMVYLKNEGIKFAAGHRGANWQSCPAVSCRRAFRAVYPLRKDVLQR